MLWDQAYTNDKVKEHEQQIQVLKDEVEALKEQIRLLTQKRPRGRPKKVK